MNLSLFLLAIIVNSMISIMINPFLAANLSPEDYAVIGYFTSFNTLVLSIISFSSLSYYARNYYKIQSDERQAVLNTLLMSQLLLGSLLLLLVMIGFYVYMYFAKVSFPFYPYVFLCFLPILFNCFYNFLLIEYRMKRQAWSYFKLAVISGVLGSFMAILFVVILKTGAVGRFWSILIPAIGIGIFCFFKLNSKFELNKAILRDAFNFGWPISLSAILYYFLSGIDRAMLERLNDTYTFGFYNVAFQIASYLSLFYTAISQTFEPDIYKAIVGNNRKKIMQIVTGIIILNAIPTIVFILFAHPILEILTHGRYTESAGFARIIALRTIPMAACFLVSNIIIGYGYTKTELVNRAIGAFLSIILFRFLIEKYSFLGAAWGQSLSYILMTMISLAFIAYKLLNRNPSHV